MRGVVSAGMTAAIEQLGFTDCFDEVHGASAGAFAAAFLLAGQAAYLTGAVSARVRQPGVRQRRRVLRGRPVFDLDYVVNEVWRHQRPLRTDRILSSGIELHCTATDVETTEQVDLTQLADDEQIRDRDPGVEPAAVAGRHAGVVPRPSAAGRRRCRRRSRSTRPAGRRPTCWCCRRDRTGSRTRRCRDPSRG